MNEPNNESCQCGGHGAPTFTTRRQFLGRFGMGLGGFALAEMLARETKAAAVDHGILGQPHFPPKAKRIIFLFMSGGPSQLDLFDYKPLLNKRNGEQLPDSVRGNQRLTGMSGNQSSIPLVGSPFKFTQQGQAGAWFSELLPHTAGIADELCVVRSMYTEAINHGPGVTFLQTGSQIAGRPSMGSWLSYGLGQDNADLPSFVVLITKDKGGQPLGAHLWGSGFLPSRHQGVLFRPARDPVLYLNNPQGESRESRRMLLDRLHEMHDHQFAGTPDAEIQSRIDQYEMAFRMQIEHPRRDRLSPDEPKDSVRHVRARRPQAGNVRGQLPAGPAAGRAGRAVRAALPSGLGPSWRLPAALPQALQGDGPAGGGAGEGPEAARPAEDTLVVWGGEFGRTNYCQGKIQPRTSAATITPAASRCGWPAAA